MATMRLIGGEPSVSTLLEILGAEELGGIGYTEELKVSTLLEILGRLHDLMHRVAEVAAVSTLLEILVRPPKRKDFFINTTRFNPS